MTLEVSSHDMLEDHINEGERAGPIIKRKVYRKKKWPMQLLNAPKTMTGELLELVAVIQALKSAKIKR